MLFMAGKIDMLHATVQELFTNITGGISVPTVNAGPLTNLVEAMIAATGSSQAEAKAVAENLVEANLMGHDSHGVGLAPRYMTHANSGTLTPGGSLSVVSDNGAYLLLDGDMGYGQVIGREAMQLGLEKARSQGVAIVGLRNVHHLGRIGAWGEICAQAGFISIHYVNGTGHAPIVATHGGYEARYSTNPYCTAIPATDKNPMVVADFATSTMAQGKVRVAHYAGDTLPDGAVVGPDGYPSNDPGVMFSDPQGAMLPMSGHKGTCLAVLCEVLAGGLTGGGTALPSRQNDHTIRNNMLTIIVDPNGFAADIPFADDIDNLIDVAKSSKPAAGFDRIMYPGDPERLRRQERAANGIPIDENTWAEMRRMGIAAGLDAGAFDSIIR
jgi:uncharacterized oxidoreductase